MKRVSILLLLIVAVGAWSAQSAHAQASATPNALSFEQALRRALEVNNAVERSRADVGVAESGKNFLFSAVLPRITLSGSAIRNSTQVDFGSGADRRTILAGNDWNYRIVLSQPVYAGRREFRAYEQSKLGVATAREAQRETEDEALLRVASNYLAIVDADALIDVEKRNIDLAEKRRKQARAFFDAGEVTKLDILRAETSIKASQRALAVAQQNRENATSRLRVDLDLEGPIAVVAPERSLSSLGSEQTLVQMAADHRADVAVALNNSKAAQLEVLKQRGFWLPTVTFDGGWINQKSTFPAARYSYAALRFNIPLLQSGEVEARVAQAKEREIQARLDLESTRVNAREDVVRALVDLHTAETSLGLAKEQLAAAQAEYDQAFELYRAQESTSLDVATSETSLASARRAVAEEVLNSDLARLRVWFAAGSIKQATLGGAGAAQASPHESKQITNDGVTQQ